MVTTLGSLTGIQCSTRSANASPTMAAYSANRSIGRAVEPAAVVLERLRQVPVVERDHRLDAVLEQRRRSAGRRTRGPCALAGPDPVGWIRGQAIEKPVAADAEPLHQRDVLVRTGGSGRRPRAPLEPSTIRPGWAVKVSQMLGPRPSSVGGALDLVRRRAGPEPEARGELGETRSVIRARHNVQSRSAGEPAVSSPGARDGPPGTPSRSGRTTTRTTSASGRWSATTTTCSGRAAATRTTRTATWRSSPGCSPGRWSTPTRPGPPAAVGPGQVQVLSAGSGRPAQRDRRARRPGRRGSSRPG